jgi:hypothetical protein
MPTIMRESRTDLESARSDLGKSLLRLQHNLELVKEKEVCYENLTKEWKEKLSNRRQQISRKLKSLETQLGHLMQEPSAPPQLAIVCSPFEPPQAVCSANHSD